MLGRKRRNALLAGVTAAALMLSLAPQAIGEADTPADREPPSVSVNGLPLQLDTAPIHVDGSLLVPVRPAAEALGAVIELRTDLNGNRRVILKRGGITAELAIGSKTMIVSGAERTLPAAPVLHNGVMLAPLRAIGEAFGEPVVWEADRNAAHIGRYPALPVVGSLENLRELAEQIESHNPHRLAAQEAVMAMPTASVASDASGSASSGSAAPAAGSADGEYSKTNVQVEGVDEADWAKTDGKFIYQRSGNSVIIADIRNPESPRLASVLEYDDDEESFSPRELYAADGRLIVIGTAYLPDHEDEGNGDYTIYAEQSADILIWPPIHQTRTLVTAKIYEVSDDGVPVFVRELQLEGHYVTSRMIGSSLYLIANKHNLLYPLLEAADADADAEPNERNFEPIWRDTAISQEPSTIPLKRLHYFPDSPEDGTLLIGAVDLKEPGTAMHVSAYLGSAGTVYASTENLYIAIPRSIWPTDAAGRPQYTARPKLQTDIYKFRLDGGSTAYAGQGSVPGHVLNQFSMDEYDGRFRIATTSGYMWAEDSADISKNNLYVLDERLKTIGSLEDLAPGERIYSARFMGSRAYMVTFRNVDPLFAIDLSDPAKPTVLGQLKIPGYSDYLHPYDEHHLIGFGKETITATPRDGRGEPMAYYLGMKLSLFDVTDVTQPKEIFKEVIGDRGTHSDLLHDHKALLFDRTSGLLAFPVELMEVKEETGRNEYDMPPYGEFVYQGAYVYRVDLDEGFNLRGRITHLSADDLAKAGDYGYDYRKKVQRILYAGDMLYTMSDAILKVNALHSLEERGALTYPERSRKHDIVYPAEPIRIMR